MQIEDKCCDYSLNKKNDAKKDKDDFPIALLKYIHDVVKKEEYATYTMEKRQISTGGGNYLSRLYEVDIKGRTAMKEKETNIFIKHILSNEQFFLSISEAYLKEKFAYTELTKIFNEIQEEVGVPKSEKFKMVKSYHSIPEAIMLENLTKKGFVTPYRMDGITLNFAELAVEQLAKFHGLSFALQKLRPDYFNQELKTLKYPFKFTENWDTFYRNMFDLTCSYLSDSRKRKLEKLLPDLLKKMQIYLTEDVVGSVLCHGDFRPNNIMIKKNNDEITEIRPVDFQLIYYGCPINDFIYFIVCGSDRNLRKNHLNHLKDLYYDSLDKFVKYFDLDIESLYPRAEFERQFKERLDYSLMSAIYVLSFIFASETDVPDVENEDFKNLQFILDERYRERIDGFMEDFEEWGLL